ncbi:MAG: TIGR00153 family protein [Planctomycetota bacterium]|nr:MAG: TIGR00153 family protein [Planctomycetota bacterium]
MSTFERFEEAPFGPLGEHMARIKECVALVEPMFQHVVDQDYEGLAKLSKQVFKSEHKADQIKNEIRETVPKTFYLPIYRGDLLAYLKLQDDIADSVEDLAVLLTIKKLVLHKSLVHDVLNYVKLVLNVCNLIFECSDELKDIVEDDFGGPKTQKILELVAKSEQAEWESDQAEFDLAQKLFALEDEIKATDIFLWSQVFRELGRLANHADKTAERLRRMLVK